MPAAQHLVEHRPEREQVGPRVERFTPRLLGGHVAHRPENQPGARDLRRRFLRVLGTRAPDPRQAEVEDLDDAGRGQEQVRRLHVAVDDALSVGRRQPTSDLARIVEGFARPKPAALHDLGERRPLQHLEDEIGAPVVAAYVEDREHVWVRERGGCLRFSLEALHPVGVRGERLGQDL
jgi:hypothetical protein